MAVVGMAGRFPGAATIDQFWQNLCDGVESIRFPDDQQLAALGVDAARLADPHYVKAASVMDDVEQFDAAFFGYTPREAELMDPQHRVFLECAWETLEHAGYDPERYRGAIGVFGGGTTNTYLLYNLVSNQAVLDAFDPMQIDVSNGPDFVTTRVSYKLNLRGPSMTVQTACSTALVAIHMACQSLLNEECDMALAGGVSVHVKHPEGYWYAEGGNVSPDGHCRAFDAQGAGTIFGSGVAAVLLKRLDDALQDGDHIHAIVKGSAINNDGSGKVGFTAPSVEGQAGVITEALALADVPADTIGYVETHGTATKLGDPIEIRALTKAFRAQTSARHSCAIGSVKTNVGHLASAAGAASFIKTVLMLEHGCIPPSLHFERPNPEIDFDSSPFYVNTALREWPAGALPRRAGVSSFGVGGTNAHAVLEQAPAPEPSGPSRPVQLLLLSAKSSAALDSAAARLADQLRAQPDLSLADVAYTLQVGRQAFSHRRMIIARDHAAALHALDTGDPQQVVSDVTEIIDRPVVFMFPGMGDQYADMALELYQHEPTFRKHVDRCAELLQPLLGLDLRTVLYPHGTAPRAAEDQPTSAQVDLRALLRRGSESSNGDNQLRQTGLAHPLLFTIEYALAKLWQSWGVRPTALIGHSIGEYVAATLAGVFALPDALMLVARRAQLIEALPPGAMLGVLLPEAELRPWLNDRLWLAAVNTPNACVVSGEIAAVAELEQQLLAQGVACQRVQTEHAFHSPLMAPIEEPLRALLRQISLQPPKVPFFSNVTGARITAAEATDPDYWARHMRRTVRFADGLQTLLQQPQQVLLEMGSGQTLTSLVKQHPAHTPRHVVLTTLRQPHQQQSDLALLLTTLGKLWLAGVTVNWSGFASHERRRRVVLPTYPFERQRYWIGATATPAAPQPATVAERRRAITDWCYSPSWQRAPLPAARADQAAAAGWLIFVDSGQLADTLAQRLTARGQPVTIVRGGAQFGRATDGSYTLNPGRREDYSALLRELAARGAPPQQIIHCASLTPDQSRPDGWQPFTDSGWWSLVFLAQALDDQAGDEPVQLWVIGRGACQVQSADRIDPGRAALLSPCRVIPQEYPQISCRYIDLAGEQLSPRLAEQLVAELHAPQAEQLVAYRGTQRWTRSFTPLPLPADAQPSAPLRQGGTYLIIDGLTSVGGALARYLARELQARLLLIEPPDFPAAERWDEWLSEHAAEDVISRKIGAARALAEHGATVEVLGVDPGDLAALRRALAPAIERGGPPHGVIYALSSSDSHTFRPLQELRHGECEPLLLPTERNLAALTELVTDWQPDFCCLISSLSAVLGGLGQAVFSADSLLIDAVAEQQSQLGGSSWLSIDLDVWQPDDASATISPTLAQFAIAPDEGVELLRRLLTQLPGGQIVISTGDLQQRLHQRPQAMPGSSLGHDGALHALHPRPALSSPYVAPRTDLERTIMRTWQEIFGLEQIGIDDNFFELGGNSLIAIHAMVRLKKVLQAEVPTAMLYQRPTIRFLAELLAQDDQQTAQQMSDQLAKRKADLSRRQQMVQRRR